MWIDTDTLTTRSREELLRRNGVFEDFFRAEAPRLAEACDEMARRFLNGVALVFRQRLGRHRRRPSRSALE